MFSAEDITLERKGVGTPIESIVATAGYSYAQSYQTLRMRPDFRADLEKEVKYRVWAFIYGDVEEALERMRHEVLSQLDMNLLPSSGSCVLRVNEEINKVKSLIRNPF